MNNYQKEIHSIGYTILKQKISIPKPILSACKVVFSNKKLTYPYNGPSGNIIDEKRYSIKFAKLQKIDIWLKTLYAGLEKNRVINNKLFYNYSNAFASLAGCNEQQAHSYYLKTKDFVNLINIPDINIIDNAIKKGDRLLYTKDVQNPQPVTVNQVHLDDYPNYYYTIVMPDGNEKQTTIKYLTGIPDTVQMKHQRLEQIPLIVITSIMDNTRIELWENSIGWMNLSPTDEYNVDVTKKTIVLQKGQVCIMRGDIIQAGSAYNNDNYRLYSYYDNINIMNDDNKCELIGNDAMWEKQIHN